MRQRRRRPLQPSSFERVPLSTPAPHPLRCLSQRCFLVSKSNSSWALELGQIKKGRRRKDRTNSLFLFTHLDRPSPSHLKISLLQLLDLLPLSSSKKQKNVRDPLPPRHPRGPRRLGHRHRHAARPGLRRRPLGLARQVGHRLEPHARGGRGLWPPPPRPARPLALCPGRRHLVRRAVCALGLLGRDPEAVGPHHGGHHAPLPGPHQGRLVRGLLGRQPPDCQRVARPHDQAVEHHRRVQVHDRRARRPLGVGLVRAVLSGAGQPDHRVCRVGQARQGTVFFSFLFFSFLFFSKRGFSFSLAIVERFSFFLSSSSSSSSPFLSPPPLPPPRRFQLTHFFPLSQKPKTSLAFSRSGTSPTASSASTSSSTRATSPPSPSPPTARSAPREGRTASRACGTWPRASASTPSTRATPSRR